MNTSTTNNKRRLFFDMDGVLVDFQSGLKKISPEILVEHNGNIDEIDGIFALMDPMPGAIEAAHTLSRYYDCHILSTSPWDNIGGCSDKMRWIRKYLGDIFYKKVTFTHHKEFLNDGVSLLIDDRKKNGADAFGDRLIEFDAEHPDWEGVTEKLIRMAEKDWCEELYQEILKLNGGDKEEAEEFKKMFLEKGRLKMNQTPAQIASILLM